MVIVVALMAACSAAASPPSTVSAEQAEAALQRLHGIIDHHSALAALHEFDPTPSLDDARRHLRDGMSLNELLLLMQRTLALIGDGHAQIELADRDARDAKRGVEGGRIEHRDSGLDDCLLPHRRNDLR